MTVSDVIHVGDRVDIRLVQQIENSDKNADAPDVYKSQILDMKENGNLEIAMPTEKGKLILLPLGVRFEFAFYCQNGGLYKGIGQIAERYKKDGFFMLEVELKTGLEKLQRREFYRYSCTMDFTFYVLGEEQKDITSADKILQDIMAAEDKIPAKQGIVADLSGGGMKIRTSYELQSGDRILAILHLANEKVNRQFHVLGKVIACMKVPASTKISYESRIKFDIEDDKIREEIIRYIFEEERKIRRKENG